MTTRDEESAWGPEGRAFRCLICGAGNFRKREIKMSSTGMSLLHLDFASKSATGVICVACGFVHMFAGGKLAWEKK
jgi:predicted nucleic-acid-binding Zn-ribbon protein